ncbi:MAG TPA: hypothetical protein VMV29_24040 [Ktedonobacterales bacterium]|nr:hypothetical protein [Ktedonobacterales bacterium]
MTAISVNLSDDQLAELAALAATKHKSPEDILADIVRAALPAKAPTTHYSILDIIGLVETNGVPDSRLHDQIIAEEAVNSHDDED